MTRLKYVGGGNAITGVPARDLTTEEITELGLNEEQLIQSGLYQTNSMTSPKSTTKYAPRDAVVSTHREEKAKEE